ncbi:Hypothetical protein NTJ_15434 [Nesidiocoris tenuis]|uniref:Fibronectin type-III domain-containing protein n=1 Tax=Nesidiocoris tenuis TaxID=355587 RepID=A0ABN7BH55_9HEMI|nr:Hypothetical protein NTJ_15434 [Nesidiocoris tenuis]
MRLGERRIGNNIVPKPRLTLLLQADTGAICSWKPQGRLNSNLLRLQSADPSVENQRVACGLRYYVVTFPRGLSD